MKSELCIIAGLSLLLCCFVISSNEESGGVNVGVGIADVTGPAAGVGLVKQKLILENLKSKYRNTNCLLKNEI